MDEARLIRQALDGSSEAFLGLVDRWAPRVLAFSHAHAGGSAAVGHAVRVFLRAAEDLPTLADPARFGPWLLGLVPLVAPEPVAPGPAPAATQDPTVAALAALPRDARALLLVCYAQRTGYADLARALDHTPDSVRFQLARTRLLLWNTPDRNEPPDSDCHPCVEALSARLDGEETPAQGEPLELHLAACHACRTRHAEWPARDRDLARSLSFLRDAAASSCATQVRDRLAAQAQARHRVLVVDDEPYILPTLDALLTPEFDVVTASSADEARAAFARRIPDVVLSDQRMPGQTGVQLLEWVRQYHPNTVRLLMTGYSELEDAVEAINRGHVYYYLLKPWRAEDLLQVVRKAAEKFDLERKREHYLDQLRQLNQELEQRVEARTRELREANQLLQQRTRELERLALTDPLTGLFNRRAMDELLRFELKRHARYPSPLTVGFVDVDHFKRVNTEHLLTGGDAVLRALARMLTASLREVDSVGRVGGEEFLVVARETGLDGAAVLAERIRKAVEQTPVDYNAHRIHITVSVGFAVAEAGVATDQPRLLELAAAALAEAKATGRNRSVLRVFPGGEQAPASPAPASPAPVSPAPASPAPAENPAARSTP